MGITSFCNGGDKVDVYIKSIRLKNVQSFEDQTFHFTDGLNIIKADSNSEGKSVLFKILREAMTPGYWGAKACKQLIRWKASYGSVLITFSDEVRWLFVLHPTTKQYIKLGEDGKPVEVYEEPPSEFLERLSCIKHEKYIANMLTTSNDLLFVESGGSNDKALLALLTTHEYIENVRDTIVDDSKRKQKVKNTTVKKLDVVNAEMEKMKLGDLEGAKRLEEYARHIPKGIETLFYLDHATGDIEATMKMQTGIVSASHIVKGMEVLDAIEAIKPDVSTLGEEVEQLTHIIKGMQGVSSLEVVKPRVDVSVLDELESLVNGMKVYEKLDNIHLMSADVDLVDRLIGSAKVLGGVLELETIERPNFEEASKVIEGMGLVVDIGVSLGSLIEEKEGLVESKREYLEVSKYLEENSQKAVCPFKGTEVYYSPTGCKEA